ncbi:MAG: tetratricopeptide repeat protein [Candidatus Melainabacteria bacterium]|nr:MAG: tetratricopeptide repeat protein [Candidatus Melainabacteria bacterium]
MHNRQLIALSALSSLAASLSVNCRPALADQSLALLDSAYRLHYQKKDDKAVEAVNKAVKMVPNQPLLLVARAEFLIRNNRYQEAVKDCDAAIKLDPKCGGAYSRRGFAYCQLGNLKAGIADLSRSIELSQIELNGWDSPFDYKNRAIAYRRLGNEKLAEKDEQMSQIYKAIERARGYRSRIQLGPAVSIMNDAVKLRPDDKYLRYFRGIATMNDGKLDTAIDDFTFVMKHDPGCLSVYYFRGDCYSRIHRMKDAIADYTKVLSKHPYVVAISDTAETGRCKGRELTYDEAIVSPADVYLLRAQQYNLLKQYDKALADFNKAIELSPSDARARMERANLYMEMKNIPMALKDCNEIIAQQPKEIPFYELRAKIFEANKQPDRALADLSKIIALSKTDPPAYLRRGQLYDRLGDYSKAIADYSVATDLNPSDDEAFRLRGSSYFKLGQYPKAISDYTEAISRNPRGNLQTYSLRAGAYDKIGKPDLAARDRKNVAEDQKQKPKVPSSVR